MNIDNYYEEQGSGSPIVFIHGSFATSSTWKKMIEQLAKNHHCISIKLPGHGGMPDPNDFDKPTVETELSIIEQVVKTLTDQPIHLVAHSYGGVVATALALKGSIAIRQMTLYEPVNVWVFNVTNDEKMQQVVKAFRDAYVEGVEKKETYASRYVIDFWGGEGSFDPLPEFIKDNMESMVKNNLRHWDVCSDYSSTPSALQDCDIPTRLVYGSDSNTAAHAIIDHLNELLPNSKKYCIDGANHFLVTSHVEQCLSALWDEPFELLSN